SVLYNFTGGRDGSNPAGSLVRDPNGNLFGTTSLGEARDFGTGRVFQLSPVGGTWTETVLYRFTGRDGENPEAGLLIFEGHLLGTTFAGGKNDMGVVFALTQN